MSINSALLAGASGLISNSSALASISDNIANVNTVGYKRASAVFTPLYDSGGSTASRYSAAGASSCDARCDPVRPRLPMPARPKPLSLVCCCRRACSWRCACSFHRLACC